MAVIAEPGRPSSLLVALPVLPLLALAACGGGQGAARDPLGGRGLSVAPEPVVFGADGLTPRLAVPASSAQSVTLWARSTPGTCFALASLEDAAGHAWVTQHEAGPYCQSCAIRTSVAQSQALFVLPAGEGFTPSGGFTVRFGLMRCDTLTPTQDSDLQPLRLSWAPRDAIPTDGVVALRFLVSARSVLYQRPDLSLALLDGLNGELAGTGLRATLAEVVELADAPLESDFSTAGLTALASLLDEAPPAPAQTIDVVFAGCLRYDDLFGPPTPVDGYTPRVVGGAGPADAVFLPGVRCDDPSPAPEAWPTSVYAHLLAHELGHFLGLYHTVERDGTTDLLADTGPHNTMYYEPSLASARGFTAAQAEQMRSHPWVRAAP